MKLSWQTFVLLLLVAIAVPIVVVEFLYFSDPAKEAPATLPPSAPDSDPGESQANARPEKKAQDAGSKETASSRGTDGGATPEVHVGRDRPYEFRGLLHGSGGVSTGEAELVLTSPDQQRPVWTDAKGNFAFVLRPGAFPATLETPAGELLFRADRAPEGHSVRVNITTMTPSNAHGGLLGARAVIFSKASTSEDCLIQALGLSRLPADTRLVVRLLAGGDKIIQETLFFYGGAELVGEIQFPFRDLYSGRYKLQLAWKVISAPEEIVAQFQSVLPNPLPGEVPSRMYLPVFLGEPEAEAEQERRIREFYDAAMKQLRLSRDLVLWIGSAVRGEEHDFDKDDRENMKRHPAFVRAGGVGKKGSFILDRWRTLIDEGLPSLWNLHRNPKAVPFPEKYPARSKNLQLAFEQLHKLTRLESRLIYRHLNKSPDRRDYVDFDFAIESEHPVTEQRLDDCLKAIRRDIRRSAAGG